MIGLDRPFKADCELWRGYRPCDVQRTTGRSDHFEPAAHAERLQRLQIDDHYRHSSVVPMRAVLVGVLGLEPRSVDYDVALPHRVVAAGRTAVVSHFGRRRPATVIGLNVGSSARGRLKRWPPRFWAGLAARLVRSGSDRGVLLLSGPDDRDARAATIEAVADFAMSGPERARIRAISGDQGVVEFLGLVAALDLVVTADSFALHAASSLRVPVVTVVGPMPHGELELGPGDRVIGPALRCAPCFYRCHQPVAGACMRALDVDQVLAGVEARLDAVRPQGKEAG